MGMVTCNEAWIKCKTDLDLQNEGARMNTLKERGSEEEKSERENPKAIDRSHEFFTISK